MKRHLGFGVTLCLTATTPLGAVVAQESVITGVWRVLVYEDRSPNGASRYPYGKPPRGHIIYTPSGHLSVQIMRTPPAGPADKDSVPPEQAQQLVRGYVAYFGRWSVDWTRQVLIHHVTGALSPDYVDTDQVRPFQVHGDTLTIDVEDAGWRYHRVFVREARLP